MQSSNRKEVKIMSFMMEESATKPKLDPNLAKQWLVANDLVDEEALVEEQDSDEEGGPIEGSKISQIAHWLDHIIDKGLSWLSLSFGLALLILAAAVFLIVDFEVDNVSSYQVKDLTRRLGTLSSSAELPADKARLNETLYSEFASFLQVTPVGEFGGEHTKDALSGRRISFSQPTQIIRGKSSFLVDLWVCLPEGRENDNLGLSYPNQLQRYNARPLQFYLVNEDQYLSTIQYFLQQYTDEDEDLARRIAKLGDTPTSNQLISRVWDESLGDDYFDFDQANELSWQLAMDSRTMLGQVDLTTNRSTGELVMVPYAAQLDKYDDIAACLELQAQGEIPADLEIPDTTAKILHYQTRFYTTNSEFQIIYRGKGTFGNDKWLICLQLTFVIFVVIILVYDIKKLVETIIKVATSDDE